MKALCDAERVYRELKVTQCQIKRHEVFSRGVDSYNRPFFTMKSLPRSFVVFYAGIHNELFNTAAEWWWGE